MSLSHMPFCTTPKEPPMGVFSFQKQLEFLILLKGTLIHLVFRQKSMLKLGSLLLMVFTLKVVSFSVRFGMWAEFQMQDLQEVIHKRST
ncbi:hypothetical protein CsatA_003458 [Cannabis sativa]